ncbi:putative inactive lipase/MT1628 [Variibacter gotjawalensis]|uniref:Putative inactive lipase/MT1628 n=1 Tax=Variibacter gotjawalensis TaxID=1333996 RepID=A0A0S3PU60_9BRAD|nr:alpha/beta fold hydrolase [Variibacter gotjawalensis]NIK49810.1 acetyl esterase/lipase [Variibacter gotjawalensis]RZS45814.1 secretory lipase [Variibacter gotjawalensis]BAT59487.1 putative inactive lipase/MT1628 [Variibacter gotjawalensis]
MPTLLTRIVKFGCGALALASASLFSAAVVAQPASHPFYVATRGETAGAPGTIIRIARMVTSPPGAIAYRVLYRSRGMRNEPIAASGVIIVPIAAAPPDGRKVVAWAHPTSGVVPHCAPSLAFFLYNQIHGLDEMIARGFVVVATDYPGLGTPGPHPYLVGTSEGRSVLDSVRAARQIPGVGAVRDFTVWGHSQGGQAALFTGMLARSYAPDLTLRGVAAAAPATDLLALLQDDSGTVGGNNLAAMALWSWTRVYGAPLGGVVEPDAMPTVDALANVCIESIQDILLRGVIGRPLTRSFLADPKFYQSQPWRQLLITNSPGTLPGRVPVFIAQGLSDETVRSAVTFKYMRRLCRAGSPVALAVLPNAGHAFIARDTAAQAVDWMARRFANLLPRNDCGRVPGIVQAKLTSGANP